MTRVPLTANMQVRDTFCEVGVGGAGGTRTHDPGMMRTPDTISALKKLGRGKPLPVCGRWPNVRPSMLQQTLPSRRPRRSGAFRIRVNGPEHVTPI